MIASMRSRRIALVGVLMIAVCAILAGCKEETPKPSAPGFYDGPMKQKASGGQAKTEGTAPQGNSAGQP